MLIPKLAGQPALDVPLAFEQEDVAREAVEARKP